MEAKHQENRRLIFQPSPFHSELRGLWFWSAGGLWDLRRFGAIWGDFQGGKWPVYRRPSVPDVAGSGFDLIQVRNPHGHNKWDSIEGGYHTHETSVGGSSHTTKTYSYVPTT